MQTEIILAKYGELALKGLNRNTFEDILMKNIKRRLKPLGGFFYTRAQSTIYIVPESPETDLDTVMETLKKIFGIAALCKACVCEKDMADISRVGIPYLEDELLGAKTFKVEAKRADKQFPLKSPEICRELGGQLLEAYPHLQVDVKHPDVTVMVEIREKNAFVHAGNERGAGGLPVGSSGKALLLLSGGIDSPVAGYRMARRGVHISAIHYVSPPYTSDRAQEIQEEIKRNCPEPYFTIIMRRLMVEIAQRIAAKDDCSALITGESIGQVASQTMQGLVCTDAVSRIPIFRPLIGMDKTEIIETARQIDTFALSTLPYEDCCTVFTPKHPKVRPSLEEVKAAQGQYDFTASVEKAVANTEMIQAGNTFTI